MVDLNNVHPDIKEVLDKEQINEKNLFNLYSDLYIGCQDHKQVYRIKNAGVWRSMSTIFVPNKGSDMDHYPIALEISFGYINSEILNKKTHEKV